MPSKKNVAELKKKFGLMEFVTLDSYRKKKPSGDNIITYKQVGSSFLINTSASYSPAIYKLDADGNRIYKNSLEILEHFIKEMDINLDEYIFINEWKGKGKWLGIRKLDVLLKTMKKDTELYEQMCYDRPRRLYVDIDLKVDDESKQYFNEFKSRIDNCKTAIKKLYPKANEHIAITTSQSEDSRGKYKYSAHIHITNAYMTHKYFTRFSAYLVKEGCDIDESVYNKANQLLKFPFQLKEADRNQGLEGRKQTPITKTRSLLDFVVQHIPSDCECIDELLKEIKVVKYKKKNKKGKWEYKKMNIQVSPNQLQIRNLNRITPYELLRCFDARPECMCGEAYWRVMVYMIRKGMSFQQFVDKFNPPYKDMKDNDKYINSWRAQWKKIKESKTTVRLEAIVNILKAQYPTFVETDIHQFIDDIVNEKNCKGEMTLIPKTTEYIPSSIYDREDIALIKYLCIACSLGTGKTQSTLEYMCRLMDQNPKAKVMFICNRITLKEDVKGNITRLEIKYANRMYDYKLLGRDNMKLPKENFVLLSTLESLHKFDVNEYDLVIIDECESVFKTFLTYGTIKEHQYEASVTTFFKLLTTAKKVFLLDGLLMGRTHRFIENLEGSPNYHTIITEEKNKQDRSIIYYKNTGLGSAHYKFMQDLLKLIMEGKKALVFMPHKTGRGSSLKVNSEGQGVYLLKQLFLNHCRDKDGKPLITEEQIAIHCGSHKNNKELFNVRLFWKDKRLILSTACITNGLSYDVEDDIHSIWIMNDSSFTDNRDLAQFQGRARHPIDVGIRYCDLNQGRVPMPFPVPTYARGDLVASNYTITFNDGYKRLEEDDRDIRYKKAITELHKDLSLEYYCKGSDVLFKMFDKIDIRIKIGDTISTNEEMEKNAKAMLEKAVTNPYKFEPHWEWENIADLGEHTAEEYWYKDRGGQLDDENRYKLEKYQLVNQFHKGTDPKVLEELWDMKNVVEAFNSLLFNGRHFIQYCFDFKKPPRKKKKVRNQRIHYAIGCEEKESTLNETMHALKSGSGGGGRSSREYFIVREMMLLKNKINDINRNKDIDIELHKKEMKNLRTELKALVWKKKSLSTLHHKCLIGRFDTGNFGQYSGSSLINKAIAYTFTPKYFEEGKFLEETFYNHLILFIQCYNPKVEIRLPFLRYKPYTVWYYWGDDSKEPINVSEVYRTTDSKRNCLEQQLLDVTLNGTLEGKDVFINGSYHIQSWKDERTSVYTFNEWLYPRTRFENIVEDSDDESDDEMFEESIRVSYVKQIAENHFGKTEKYEKYVKQIEDRESRKKERELFHQKCMIKEDSDAECSVRPSEERGIHCRDCNMWWRDEDTLWRPRYKIKKKPKGTGTYEELVKENGKFIRKEFKTKMLGYRYVETSTCGVCKGCYGKTMRKKWGFILLIAKLKAMGARVKKERKEKSKLLKLNPKPLE
tara:strand:+ start:822 stop:5108 length:4287 start_codon:yes stop_codon:yes gene_type:complete